MLNPTPCLNLCGQDSPYLALAEVGNAELSIDYSASWSPSGFDNYLHSYYQNFHASHPFVLPKRFLFQLADRDAIEALLCCMRWVGSLHMDSTPATSKLFEEAHRKVYDPAASQDAFLLQAMMVMLIGLDGSRQLEQAKKLLDDASTLAVKLGLNLNSFATLHGKDSPVLQESWRRTWWDLYIIDGMIAGVHRTTNFALFDVQADACLPCEEWQYQAGVSRTNP
jgi:hypothetical protein